MPPVWQQDELFVGQTLMVDALAYLADAPAEARGAIHTRPEVAGFILDLAGWSANHELSRARLLEPSAGEGDFLLPAVERLIAQVKPGDSTWILPCIRAVEVNSTALATCRKRLADLFRQYGWRAPQTRNVLDTWLIHADFLTVSLNGNYTHIVGNPPYIRLESLPKGLLQSYRARWSSLFDRADLYVAFIERSLDLLAPEGRLGFICADRWMKNRYGGPLRAKVAQEYHLDIMVDFTGCPAFFDEVDAYPAVSIIRRGKGETTRVAFRPEISESSLKELSGELLDQNVKENGLVSVRRNIAKASQPWMFNEDGMDDIIKQLEVRFPLLEDEGCKVGIGVATGADAIFIGTADELDVELERRLPLVMTKDIREGKVAWQGLWVLNPFENDGTLVDPDVYPKFRDYIGKHRSGMQKRNVAGRNPHGWFRTIDRIHADLTRQPKLLIPDIKGHAHVVYESGKYYPHHNLYYVVSKVWDLHALRVVLSSRVAQAFVSAYCPKMRGGFLRFQAQYLRRIRLPQWKTLDKELRKSLIALGKRTELAMEEDLVREVYGLEKSEWEALLPGKGA